MKTPTPRDSNFMGRRSPPGINPDGTWIESEEITYPSGGFHRKAYVTLRKNEHNPIELPYGEKRLVICSINDTYFSIPARFKYRGKRIKGFISGDRETLTFTPSAGDCLICAVGHGCRANETI